MSDRHEGPPVDTQEGDRERIKRDWEKRCNDALSMCQSNIAALRNSKLPIERRSRETFEHIRALLDVLYAVPMEYRGLSFELEFSAADIKEWGGAKTIREDYKIPPEKGDKGQERYRFSLIAPRFHDWSKSGFSEFDMAHRGSPVRDYHAAHPDIDTIKEYLGWPDHETRQNGMLQIIPYHAVAGRLQPSFHVFPRNIIRFELSEQLPTYLSNEEKEGLNDWYEREFPK